MEKLNVKALASGLGVTWALAMLFAGWASVFGWGTICRSNVIVYWFHIDIFWGCYWSDTGFINGATGGAVIAYVYIAVPGKK